MLKPLLTLRDMAERYHHFMPDEVRQFLKGQGIAATLIDRQLLGWNGKHLTIPVFGDSTRDVLGFRYATLPKEPSDSPEVISEAGAKPELCGRETLSRKPQRVVICDGEFDRLLLESRGFPAVTSTGGAGAFLREWAPLFDGIEDVFICFARGRGSDAAAMKVQQIMPRSRIAKFPAAVGEGGTLSDFLRMLGTNREFEVLLASGVAAEGTADPRPQIKLFWPANKAQERRVERARSRVPLHDVVFEFTNLQASGGRLVGHCPLHNDNSRSFSVYPETDTYSCSVCGAEGDNVMFLMNKESLTFGQALEALERFEITHELYGSS